MNDRLHTDEPLSASATEALCSPANRAARWRVDLLGGFRVDDGSRCLTRLHSRHVVALLARLALWPHRDHPREELVELLWPGVALGVGRNRLRQALSSLKTVLGASDALGAPLLQADRMSVRLADGSVDCDAREFERYAARGDRGAALALYRGELLPGFYDEWVLVERARLEAMRDALSVVLSARRAAPTGQGDATIDANPVRPTGVWPPHLPEHTMPPPAPRNVGGERGLPNYLTRLFGAEAQGAALRDAVRAHRLVTVVGPGGGGKTRLAIEVARTLYSADLSADRSATEASDVPSKASPFDAVVLVPLRDARNGVQLVDALRSALRLDATAEVLDGVAARFGGRRALLLLDNFEQLVGHGEAWVARLAAALPQLHVLVTSRRSLGLDGERLFVLAPLTLPEAAAPLVAAVGNPAVAMFSDRAAAVRGDFRVSAANHAAIVGLVRLLEGSPLAIELAASRARSFAPAELLARLRQPAPHPGATPALDVLARHPGAVLDPRHASLHRTIAWSWQLLTEPQRTLACAMTVFRGGCSAEMLQAVCGGTSEIDAATGDARLGLDELLAHSLVQGLSATTGTSEEEEAHAAGNAAEPPLRFQLYEPIREFAAARLSATQAAHWRARHRAWAVAWAEALPTTAPLDAVRTELPNLEAAFASAAGDADGASVTRLLWALRRVLRFVVLPESSLDHIAAAFTSCEDTGLRLRARCVLAIQLMEQSRMDDARRQVEASLAEAPAAVWPVAAMPADAAWLRGHALVGLAWQRWRSAGDPAQVLPLIEEAGVLAEHCGDVELQFDLLALHGFATGKLGGDPALQQGLHRRGLALRLAYGDQHAVLAGRYNLGQACFIGGDRPAALVEFRAVAAQACAIGNRHMQSRAEGASGSALSDMRRWPEAVDMLRRTLRSCWEQGASRSDLAYALWNIGRPLAHVRLPLVALQVTGFIAVHWVRHIGELSAEDRFDLRRVRRLAAVQCAPVACADAWRRGEAMSLADAVATALGH